MLNIHTNWLQHRQKTLELIGTALRALPARRRRRTKHAGVQSSAQALPAATRVRLGAPRRLSLSSSLPNKEVPSSEALRRSRCCAGPNCTARLLLQMNPWKAGFLLRGRQAFRLAELLSREGGTVGCSRRALGCGGSASERGEEMQDVAACSANLWLLAADSAGLLPVTWPCGRSRPCRGQWDRAGGVVLAGGPPGHTDTQLSGKKKKKKSCRAPLAVRTPSPGNAGLSPLQASEDCWGGS